MQFYFHDYDGPNEISDTLKLMFPKGTSLGHIEKILLNIRGVYKFERDAYLSELKRHDNSYSRTVIYIYEPPTLWEKLPFYVRSTLALNSGDVYRVIIDVDMDDHLLNVWVKY